MDNINKKINLTTDVTYLKGVGPRRAKTLKDHHISDIGDLLYYYPRKYIDRSIITRMNMIKVGQEVSVVGKVQSCGLKKTRKRNYYQVTLNDNYGNINLIWFHALSWITGKFEIGDVIAAYGKVDFFNGFNITHPEFDSLEDNDDPINTGQIIAIYPGTSELKKVGLESKGFRKIIRNAIEKTRLVIFDYFPDNFLKEYGLINRCSSIINIHQPDNSNHLKNAIYRLKFDEHFFLQLLMALRKKRIENTNGRVYEKKGHYVKKMYNEIPFTLTNSQIKVLKEIRSDLNSKKQMNRLLQGDVGSGKTIVATLIASIVIGNNSQVAVLAPTELLAEQHYRSFKKYCDLVNIKSGLLTGSLSISQKNNLLDELKSGELQIIIGTHALIQDQVVFEDLGLVIIDEQHRFGVEQRKKIIDKGYNPEILAMTATPIPRTLAFTYHGDIDVSVIDELPKNRKKIETKVVQQDKLNDVYDFIKKILIKGQQCFIVYPLIDDSEHTDLKAAKTGYEKIKNIFSKYNVGYLDGKMKIDERNKIMDMFSKNKINILVSTTVIEVGIDVPNSTLMIIDNAERFGLSQLHQLRGRVGRGSQKSFCILIARKFTPDSNKRLKIMEYTNDGFIISDEDLKIRGPGDYFGKKQHGYMKLKIGNIIKDGSIIRIARNAAFSLIEKDPKLNKKENIPIKKQFLKYYKEMIEFIDIS
ncbi:MAG: ATP-dependent DNA helicase RecG [Candidatus Marinimicrobia bacterium]|nr:ATP-dependent DNA helicase RecG [Candidatus Neomarinimicrobiota bacterium]